MFQSVRRGRCSSCTPDSRIGFDEFSLGLDNPDATVRQLSRKTPSGAIKHPAVAAVDPIRDAHISALFRLYDLRGEGSILAPEFRAVQGLVLAHFDACASAPRPAPNEPPGPRDPPSVLPSPLSAFEAARAKRAFGDTRQIRLAAAGPSRSLVTCDAQERRAVVITAAEACGWKRQKSISQPRSISRRTRSEPILSMASLDTSLPATHRSPSKEPYGREDFKSVDRDGDGQITFEEFSRWQNSLMDASRRPRVAQNQLLLVLTRELRRMLAMDKRVPGWRELSIALALAKKKEMCRDLQGAIESLQRATESRSAARLQPSEEMLQLSTRNLTDLRNKFSSVATELT